MEQRKHRLYDSGDLYLPQWVRQILDIELIGSHKKTFYVNLWSILHAISGIITGFILHTLGYTKNYYLIAFIVHTLWEIWQIIIGMSSPFRLTGNSNVVDIFVDTIMFMFGAYIYKSLLIR